MDLRSCTYVIFTHSCMQSKNLLNFILLLGIINSEIYLKQYDEFVSTNEIEEPTGYSDVPVFHWHSIQDVADNERQLKKYKTIYLPEIASQFRPSDIFLSIKFDTGFGINHDGGGFSTDVSDTCHWLTPFVKEPEDPYDLL